MIPWELLGTAAIPGDDGEMRLFRRGEEYAIRVGPHELMNSRVHASEDALAELACERLTDSSTARVLIGGLGMGFTLAGTLSRTGKAASIVVAELVPEVVEWNRNQMAAINGAAMADPRVTIDARDVAEVIRANRESFDAVLLDVDNGPSALTSKRNERLYSVNGLRAAREALRSKGILAVWSAGNDPAFTKRLQKARFAVEAVPVRARGRSGGSRFLIWIARVEGLS